MWSPTKGGLCNGRACGGAARTKEYKMVSHVLEHIPHEAQEMSPQKG
jgi:hypothetical protein